MTLLAMGHLQWPDYAVLIGYFVLMLGIGVYFYRFMRGMKDYFSGGNNIPWWLGGKFSAQTAPVLATVIIKMKNGVETKRQLL